MKKPTWVIEKERGRRASSAETVWLFGLHAVRDALLNPGRERMRLVLTRNAADKLAEAVATSGMEPEVVEPRAYSRRSILGSFVNPAVSWPASEWGGGVWRNRTKRRADTGGFHALSR